MKGRELANFIAKIIRDKKGRDIKIVNVKDFAILTDYFIISTVEVPEHGKAIKDEIEKRLKFQDNLTWSVERDKSGLWIVLDFGSVIVHIMTEEKRAFYEIERLWEKKEPLST